MASLSVRNLEDDVVVRLKQRAARNGRSAEAEARDILKRAVSGEIDSKWDELAAAFRKLTAGRDSIRAEDLIRQARDEH